MVDEVLADLAADNGLGCRARLNWLVLIMIDYDLVGCHGLEMVRNNLFVDSF
jgi:hypothetical protein